MLDETVAKLVPKSTAVGLDKLVPRTVTRCPPPTGPELAITWRTTGVAVAEAGDAKGVGPRRHNVVTVVTATPASVFFARRAGASRILI